MPEELILMSKSIKYLLLKSLYDTTTGASTRTLSNPAEMQQ